MSREKMIAEELDNNIDKKIKDINNVIGNLEVKIEMIEMLEFTEALEQLPRLLNLDFEISDKENIKSEINGLKRQLTDLKIAQDIVKDRYLD